MAVEKNTIIEPGIWNVTTVKGNDFSKTLEINMDITGATVECEIIGSATTISPTVTMGAYAGGVTSFEIKLSAAQTATMDLSNVWYFRTTLGDDVTTFWRGNFTLTVDPG